MLAVFKISSVEFQKQIKNKELLGRIAAVERADKLTERQLAARVREFFEVIPSK